MFSGATELTRSPCVNTVFLIFKNIKKKAGKMSLTRNVAGVNTYRYRRKMFLAKFS